jgi:hypothetical protein
MKRIALVLGLWALFSPLAARSDTINLEKTEAARIDSVSMLAGTDALSSFQTVAPRGYSLGSFELSAGALAVGGVMGSGDFSSASAALDAVDFRPWERKIAGQSESISLEGSAVAVLNLRHQAEFDDGRRKGDLQAQVRAFLLRPISWVLALLLLAGAIAAAMLKCWHRQMSWPAGEGGYSYQSCLGCGKLRLFDEETMKGYGPLRADLEELVAWDKARKNSSRRSASFLAPARAAAQRRLCWHKMGWPTGDHGNSFQICVRCGALRLFDEMTFSAYGPYFDSLDELMAWQTARNAEIEKKSAQGNVNGRALGQKAAAQGGTAK